MNFRLVTKTNVALPRGILTPRLWAAAIIAIGLVLTSAPNAWSENPTKSVEGSAAKDESTSQLTLELRDGSRVVGKSLDDPLKFHSASLGDFKLPVVGIRSIEFKGNGDGTDNTARLTATNGDAIDVQLVASALHVQTSFGKSELPVKMVRSIKVLTAEEQSRSQAVDLSSLIQNSSFEIPAITSGSTWSGFIAAPTNAFWTFVNSAAIGKNGCGLNQYQPVGTTNGSQYACLQGINGIGAAISQTISNLPSGTYSFTFTASQRCTYPVYSDNTQNQTVSVFVDGTNFGSFTPPDQNWYSYETAPISLSAGNHILTFTNLPVPGDASILIDNVGIKEAQETKPVSPIDTHTNEIGSQLTLDLRDGSRVMGRSLDDPLKFHSASLGDFKLPVVGIRSIEFTANGDTNTARLTATNGDVIDVQFVSPALHVQTGFGKSELPVKMIRSIKVSSASQPGQLAADFPPGLVALWSGNGNGNDSIGTNNAIVPPGITYAPAKVGNGFQFDGNTGGLSVPASPELNVGRGPGFTLLCSIIPTSASMHEPLMEWGGNGLVNGIHFWISENAGGIGGPGCLFANLVDTANQSHIFSSPLGTVQGGLLQRVALTYDKDSGIAKMYYNGSVVASQNFGSFTPMTDKGLLIGERNERDEVHYQGILSDVALFNRALSPDEILAIYTAQNKGEVAPKAKPFVPSSLASTNETSPQLTLELRDGSRVVGKSLDDPLKFHSASLGDFKLPVVGIRSIEFKGNGNGADNAARLTATNGDVIDVQFVSPALHVQTGFGKSEVPVKMIKTVQGVSSGNNGQHTDTDFVSTPDISRNWFGNRLKPAITFPPAEVR